MRPKLQSLKWIKNETSRFELNLTNTASSNSETQGKPGIALYGQVIAMSN